MEHDFKLNDRIEYALDGDFDSHRGKTHSSYYDLGTVVTIDDSYVNVKWDSDGEVTSPVLSAIRKLVVPDARPHAELIKAWADGAKIQYFHNGDWYDVNNPSWASFIQYRIKPNQIKLIAFIDEQGGLRWIREELFESANGSCIRVPSEDKVVEIEVTIK